MRPLTLSECDGRCPFDQLRAPESMRPYFGRPPVRARSLIDTGFVSLFDIRRSSLTAPLLLGFRDDVEDLKAKESPRAA